jgi:hypothetical protein
MKFTDRKDFVYDSEVFKRLDVQTALKIYAEYVKAHTPTPRPGVLEVDHSTNLIDPVWHVPLGDRTPILRKLEVPMIIRTSKQKWTFDRGIRVLVPTRTNQMTMAHNHLAELNYWPQKGDFIIYSGYRNIVIEVELPNCG